MPYLDPAKRKAYARLWSVKFRKRESNANVTGKVCVCSRRAVKIVDNQPVCQRCLDIDARTHEWNPELKYGSNGRVEAARPTRKHYHQSSTDWEKEYA